MRPALQAYRPQPHRCEVVRELDGVIYINDSKATNLDALEKALTSEDRPDWDLGTPGLREAWKAGDLSRFHGWDKRGAGQASSAGQKE